MEGKEEDVNLGANKYAEHQPIGTAAQTDDKDYKEPPPAPLFEPSELASWSFYRAGIAEFIATFLFLYITVLTVMGVSKEKTKCSTVGIQGIAWAFGGMIFALVYCTAGISGGHINPAVTFGLFLARKLSLTRALYYIVMQCLGAICGAGVIRGFEGGSAYKRLGGGANVVAHGYTKGSGLGAEIIGTFVLVYTVFSATDAKRSARDSHVPILAPLPIGFAVFLVHLATIPITGTGINPARSLGAAIIYNKDHAWDDHENKFRGPSEIAVRLWERMPDFEKNGANPKQLVRATGLDLFIEAIGRGIHITSKSKGLVQALSEFWWDTTHNFHLSWGELTVTPADFTAITGLQFTRRPVTWRDHITAEEFRALVGFELIPKGLGMETRNVEVAVQNCIRDFAASEVTAHQLARAFVWLMLSVTIFANSGTLAMTCLLDSLEDVDEIGTVSWGEAGLAELYFSLDLYSCNKAASMDCFSFALEVWFCEVIRFFPWNQQSDVTIFPAMIRWRGDARDKFTGKTRITFDYKMVRPVINKDGHDGVDFYPWGRYPEILLGEAVEATRQRRWLTGLTCDVIYLGDRFSRQHGHVPPLDAITPHDRPARMLQPRDWSEDDIARYQAGVAAEEYFDMDTPYAVFVEQRLRTPQKLVKLAVTQGYGEAEPSDPPIPPVHLSYVVHGVPRRLRIPVPDAREPQYTLPPDSTVPARTYDRSVRQNRGWKDMCRSLLRKLACASKAAADVQEPGRKRRHVGGTASTSSTSEYSSSVMPRGRGPNADILEQLAEYEHDNVHLSDVSDAKDLMREASVYELSSDEEEGSEA